MWAIIGYIKDCNQEAADSGDSLAQVYCSDQDGDGSPLFPECPGENNECQFITDGSFEYYMCEYDGFCVTMDEPTCSSDPDDYGACCYATNEQCDGSSEPCCKDSQIESQCEGNDLEWYKNTTCSELVLQGFTNCGADDPL